MRGEKGGGGSKKKDEKERSNGPEKDREWVKIRSAGNKRRQEIRGNTSKGEKKKKKQMESKLDKKWESEREQTEKGGAESSLCQSSSVQPNRIRVWSLTSKSLPAKMIFYLKSIPVSLICSGLLMKLLPKPGECTHFQHIIVKECVQITSPSRRCVSLRNDIYEAQSLKQEPQMGKNKQTSQTFSVMQNHCENHGGRPLSPKLLSLRWKKGNLCNNVETSTS